MKNFFAGKKKFRRAQILVAVPVFSLLFLALSVPVVQENLKPAALSQDQAESSVEVGFSSLSPMGLHGGEIIPASCESGLNAAHTASLTVLTAGFNPPTLGPGEYSINSYGNGPHCFGLTQTKTLVPTKTWAEFSSFLNALSRVGAYNIP